jgi:hypothetical protein
MPAPKGNQYAKDHGYGRPRTYTTEFIENEAKAFYEWADTDEAIVFREFAPIRGYPSEKLYQWEKENEVFRNAFKYAKDVIGARREKMQIANKSDKPYLKYANWHDEEIDKFEKDQLKFENDLKKQTVEEVSDEYKTLMATVMNQLKSIQPERKQSNTSSSADTKSD